jgi:nicotinate-nucleotide adenylyltransferase
VGSDSAGALSTWRDSARILEECTVVAVTRPGCPRAADAPTAVVWVDGPGLPVAASDVRSRVHDGRSIRFLVPDAVADYIVKRGLYR